MARPFKRVDGDRVRLTLTDDEVELLRGLPGQLRDVLAEGEADPANDRLFPPAYDDPAYADEAAEYRRLMHDELLRNKLGAIDTMLATFERGRSGLSGRWTVDLTEDEALAWLGVLNDVRLTLGVRLDVTDDLDGDEVDPDDPRAPAFRVLYYLGWLQEHLLDALNP